MFKDEQVGDHQRARRIKSKLYSYKVFEGKEEKKCKGVKKPFVKRSIKFDVPTPTP